MQIVGNWQDLSARNMQLEVENYQCVAVFLDLQIRVPSCYASIATRLSQTGPEAYQLANELEKLYSQKCKNVVLLTDDPEVRILFEWFDPNRSVAKVSGRLIQQLSSDKGYWSFESRFENFLFEGFYLQRLAEFLRKSLTEYGVVNEDVHTSVPPENSIR